MKIIFSTLLFTITICAFSQVNNKDLIADLSAQTGRSLYLRPNETDPIISKYYLNTEFKKAYVKGFEKGNEYRYNGFTDNFEFIENGELLNLVKNSSIRLKFNHNESVYQYLHFFDTKGNSQERFLEIVIDGTPKYSLYKSFEVTESANDNINGYKSTEEKKINITKEFLIGINGTIHSIPRSTKKLNQILSINVEEIIKSNKLNLKKQEDLVKLIEILNK